jgi:hypothetical protein
MRQFLSLILFISCFSILSCGNSVKKTDVQTDAPVSNPVSQSLPPAKDSFPAGTVIKNVNCISDPSQSYALYLPKKLRSGRVYPVVFLFDAHARGTLPLEKYKDLSDRYGFILACSNNSKNQLDVNTILSITSNFFRDVIQRLPVDEQNIFTGGFSGGARVAIGIALQDKRVKGVIANSAGFDPRQEPLRKDVCFVGLVGNEDFNLAELKKTQLDLNATGNTNDLLIFNGKHDWAPVSDMDKAFLLFTLEGVRAKRMEKNDSILNASYAADEKEAQKIMNGKSDVLTRVAACHLMNLYYAGLKPVEKYKLPETMYSSAPYLEARKKEKEASAAEQSQQDVYAKEFQQKDLVWWKGEIARLQTEIKSSKDKDRASTDKRLLAFLSLVAFMNTNAALKEDARPQAEQFLTIYRLVDPTNSEWAYLSACLDMRNSNTSSALANLEQAVSLGFNEVERARSQQEFQALLNDAKFNEVLAKVKMD